MEDITQPLKEIIDKGFPDPRINRLIVPGDYRYVEPWGTELHPSNSEQTQIDRDMADDTINIGYYFDGPFLPIRNGASYTLYDLMRALHTQENIYPTLMNCFREWDVPEDYYGQDFRSVFIAPEDYYHDTGVVRKSLDNFDIQIAQFYNPEVLLRLGSLLMQKGVKIMLDVQNIDHVLLQRLGASQTETDKAMHLQIDAIAMTDHTFCRSVIDKQYIVDLGIDPDKVSVYRGGIFAGDFKFRHRTQDTKKLLCLGHMYYQPNEEALDQIVENIMPGLDHSYTLTVIGSTPPYVQKKYESNKIHFRGGVDNLSNELLDFDIAVAPIYAGSGTRLKILDYLASGIPVITTDLGIEGLDPSIRDGLTIENDIHKYPEIIKNISSRPASYQLRAQVGRRIIENVFDWSHCVQPFIKTYKETLDL